MTPIPAPVPLHHEAFGRPHDDRAPLFVAGSVAVLLHVLVFFIPLPKAPQPDLLPEPPGPPPIRIWTPPPPDVRKPPTKTDVEPVVYLEPIPVPPMDDLLPIAEPDYVETAEPAEILPMDLPLELIPPPPIPDDGIVDANARGLMLPVPIDRPEPDFPEVARLARRSGRVVLRAVIDREGRVGDIEILSAPRPDLGFTDKAIEALSAWRYRPGEVNGRVVAVRMTVVVEFNLR